MAKQTYLLIYLFFYWWIRADRVQFFVYLYSLHYKYSFKNGFLCLLLLLLSFASVGFNYHVVVVVVVCYFAIKLFKARQDTIIKPTKTKTRVSYGLKTKTNDRKVENKQKITQFFSHIYMYPMYAIERKID